MSRNPAERPQSAGELVRRLEEALAPVLSGEPGVPAPATRPRPSARRRIVPVAAEAPIATEPPAPARRPGRTRPATATQPTTVREPRIAAAPPTAHQRRARWLTPLLLGLLGLIVLAVVLLSSGGSSHRGARSAAVHHRRAHAGAAKRHAATAAASSSQPAQSTSSSTPSSPPQATPPSGSTPPGSPVSAVERFYELAAAHRYPAAWALADPAFRSQLGGYDSFVAGQSGDRRIIFDSAAVTSRGAGLSTVAVRTTSVRTNGTQHCGGTVQLVHSAGQWLLHQISINCTG